MINVQHWDPTASQGYWQVPLTQRAHEVSAFVTPNGLFSHKVMPFGLRNAPATFQRLMTHVTWWHGGLYCLFGWCGGVLWLLVPACRAHQGTVQLFGWGRSHSERVKMWVCQGHSDISRSSCWSRMCLPSCCQSERGGDFPLLHRHSLTFWRQILCMFGLLNVKRLLGPSKPCYVLLLFPKRHGLTVHFHCR